MKKTLTGLTVAAVALAAAVMAFAAVDAPRTGATTALCHMTELTIAAPAAVKAGKTLRVAGAEAVPPSHPVKATLQYKPPKGTSWKNGPSTNLSNGAYVLKWKAPAKKGVYKIRVRVSRQSTFNTSATLKVNVK